MEPIEIGCHYEISMDAKSCVSENVIIEKGEIVTAVKRGTDLYLIEARASESGNPRRCWVPNYWLKKVDVSVLESSKSVDSELDAVSIGESTYSEYSISKSCLESRFSTERSRTNSALSSHVSSPNRKFKS